MKRSLRLKTFSIPFFFCSVFHIFTHSSFISCKYGAIPVRFTHSFHPAYRSVCCMCLTLNYMLNSMDVFTFFFCVPLYILNMLPSVHSTICWHFCFSLFILSLVLRARDFFMFCMFGETEWWIESEKCRLIRRTSLQWRLSYRFDERYCIVTVNGHWIENAHWKCILLGQVQLAI